MPEALKRVLVVFCLVALLSVLSVRATHVTIRGSWHLLSNAATSAVNSASFWDTPDAIASATVSFAVSPARIIWLSCPLESPHQTRQPDSPQRNRAPPLI